MNLIVGDSHPHFAFDINDQTVITEDLRIIHAQDWVGISHYSGLTIYSATKNIEKELLENDINISGCENVVYIFGSNDALVKRENAKHPSEYVGEYIQSIENIRAKYSLKKAYVIIPFHIRDLEHLEYWDHIRQGIRNFQDSNKLIIDIRDAIIKEAKDYKDVHVIDMTNLFYEDNDHFHEKYSRDGMHFNEAGKKKFFEKLKEEMNK